MRNLIASIVVAFVALVGFSAPALAGGPNASTCAVGKAAPAYQDAALADINMTWTCDSQSGTGGFNFKPLGSSKPLYFKKCVLRWQNVGGTKACKVGVSDVIAAEDNGKAGVILKTTKGMLFVTKGSFGMITIKKI